jgi:TraM recognition site of TraD and TraG
MSRSDVPEADRRDFYLYIDEFPSFATASFTGMLSEMRKYRLNLVLADQYMTQVDETVRDAILDNAGTVIAFRTGLTDALVLEKEFHPEFTAHDLVNLPNYHIYLKLMIDGVVSKAFSASTLPSPVANPECRSYA